jgi:hypothetical protein
LVLAWGDIHVQPTMSDVQTSRQKEIFQSQLTLTDFLAHLSHGESAGAGAD